MSFIFKILIKKQDGKWIGWNQLPVTPESSIELDSDNDLAFYKNVYKNFSYGCMWLITDAKMQERDDYRYVFYNDDKILYSLEIDFSQVQVYNTKEEYIAKYRPELERMLELVKIRINRDNVKKLLDKI